MPTIRLKLLGSDGPLVSTVAHFDTVLTADPTICYLKTSGSMSLMPMASHIEHWPLDRFIPYARNARTHSDEQIAQIAESSNPKHS